MTTLHINIQLADQLIGGILETELEAVALEAILVRLYKRGAIGSQQAAEQLGIERSAFFSLLARYNVQKEWADMSASERESFYQELRAASGTPTPALVRAHFDAGVSMYGADPRYPGEIVEHTPDGHIFIVVLEGDSFVRVRQVEEEP
jgi:hypothetical protein